jgi:putative nucleotidyltransferase with HDIG domain
VFELIKRIKGLSMSKISLAEIVAKVERLPELPQVAMRVSQMLEDPNANAEKLADVIRLDASFTSQVLRLCNSAAFGLSRKITTVKEAVAILGFKSLKSMVYTIIAKVALDRPVPGYSLQDGELWHNALTCAVYSKHIAQKERLPDAELAFTCGLLRDIGKIVLGEYVGANYAEIEQLTVRERIDFVEAEERVIGFNHSLVGTRVAEKWNLPPILTNVIRHHHKPIKLPPNIAPVEAKLITIVHLADVFTSMIGQGAGSDGLMYSLDMEALSKSGINVMDNYLERTLGELVDLNPVIKSLADSLTAKEEN